MMVSKEEMVDVLKTAAVSRFFFFCPGLYLAIRVSSWANFLFFFGSSLHLATPFAGDKNCS